MSKIYTVCSGAVAQRAERLIELYHSEVKEAGVTIDFLFAYNENGNAVELHGYPALAVCKVINLKDRVKGCADVEITIDGKHFGEMSEEQKNALLDHELKHIVVMRDKDGDIATDDHGRPVIEMRKHDYQMGWFTEIAERHGLNSPEVTQARILWANDGQAYFPVLSEIAEAKPETAPFGIVPKTVAETMAEDISRETGGKVSIEVHGEGPFADHLRAAAEGTEPPKRRRARRLATIEPPTS